MKFSCTTVGGENPHITINTEAEGLRSIADHFRHAAEHGSSVVVFRDKDTDEVKLRIYVSREP